MNLCRDHCRPAWRSGSAATDAIGFYHFIDSLYESQALCRERHAAPLQRSIDTLIFPENHRKPEALPPAWCIFSGAASY